MLLLTAMFIITIVSFNFAHARPLITSSGDKTQMIEKIKVQQEFIRQRQNINDKLEKQVRDKLIVLDQLKSRYYQENGVSTEKEKNQLSEKMDSFKDMLVRIDKIGWNVQKLMIRADKQMSSGKYEAVVKILEKTMDVLERRHHLLIKVNASIDDIIESLNSRELK